MNINTLFKMQESFDVRILEEKNLTWEETFQSRILAFIDEVAECMKEWQGFKFWKKDNAPKTEKREYTDERKLTYIVVGNPLFRRIRGRFAFRD